jgi:hypothetical protein
MTMAHAFEDVMNLFIGRTSLVFSGKADFRKEIHGAIIWTLWPVRKTRRVAVKLTILSDSFIIVSFLRTQTLMPTRNRAISLGQAQAHG